MLDRGIANSIWRIYFPKAYVEHLIYGHLDHNPILPKCGKSNQERSHRPFRFSIAWLLHPDYP